MIVDGLLASAREAAQDLVPAWEVIWPQFELGLEVFMELFEGDEGPLQGFS
jgi:hypothetical protein